MKRNCLRLVVLAHCLAAAAAGSGQVPYLPSGYLHVITDEEGRFEPYQTVFGALGREYGRGTFRQRLFSGRSFLQSAVCSGGVCTVKAGTGRYTVYWQKPDGFEMRSARQGNADSLLVFDIAKSVTSRSPDSMAVRLSVSRNGVLQRSADRRLTKTAVLSPAELETLYAGMGIRKFLSYALTVGSYLPSDTVLPRILNALESMEEAQANESFRSGGRVVATCCQTRSARCYLMLADPLYSDEVVGECLPAAHYNIIEGIIRLQDSGPSLPFSVWIDRRDPASRWFVAYRAGDRFVRIYGGTRTRSAVEFVVSELSTDGRLITGTMFTVLNSVPRTTVFKTTVR